MRSLVRVQYRPPRSEDRDAPGPPPARETRSAAESRVRARRAIGTTRERPANRPGIRPLARHERAVPAKAGPRRRVEPRGVEPLVLSGREVLRFSGAERWQRTRDRRSAPP